MNCGLERASIIASKRKLGKVGLSFRLFAQLARIDKRASKREREREREKERESDSSPVASLYRDRNNSCPRLESHGCAMRVDCFTNLNHSSVTKNRDRLGTLIALFAGRRLLAFFRYCVPSLRNDYTRVVRR